MKKILFTTMLTLGVFTFASAIQTEYGKASNCVRTQNGPDVTYSYNCSPNPNSVCSTTNGNTRTIGCECRDAINHGVVSSTITIIRSSSTTDSDGSTQWTIAVDEN